VVDPLTGEVLVAANTELDEAEVRSSRTRASIEVKIRSVLTCQTRRGVCAQVLRPRPRARYMVNIGEAVGIIAAQSIGEPGTQLTMRTFHIGGAARRGKIERATSRRAPRAPSSSSQIVDANPVVRTKKDGQLVVMNRHGELVIVDDTGREREHYRLVYGAKLKVAKARRSSRQLLAEWDPSRCRSSPRSGRREVRRLVEGVTVQEQLDEVTGLSRKVVIESKRGRRSARASRSRIRDRQDLKLPGLELEARYLLPVGANIVAQDGDVVEAGDIIAKIPRETTKTRTSPAVCRAWPSSSRPASPRTTPSSPRSTAR
jgi:DNA-directed RNA polymerase subunit beta'